MRSLHPADAVHKGFGTIPTSILQRKNGVCIYKKESVEQVADAEGMLSEVSSAADSMIYRLDVCFEHYPEFLKNPKIRQKVVGLLQKAKDYIVKLEGEFAYD